MALRYPLLKIKLFSRIILFIIFLISASTSCQQQSSYDKENRLKIVATTSLVGDVVSNVGGDKISYEILLPLGTDPHSFSPTPRDASEIYEATIIFANGAGLEEFLKPLLDNVGGSSKLVNLSDGIKFRSLMDEESGRTQLVDDPHTWMDPNNVIIWVDNVVRALSEQDPQNATYYLNNGFSYQTKLRELDEWIRSEISVIPEKDRNIVTEHLIFGYFSDRYGFSQVGAIIPGFSSLAEPSAQDIAHIENVIRTMDVKAIFSSVGVNANIAHRISDDTGTRLVLLYTESLSDNGGEADNYLDFMRYDVTKIVDALR